MEHVSPASPVVVPRFSLVVPAWNEEALLPRLLDTVEAARARFSRGPDAVEVIVADNASTDRTAVLAREHGYTVVRVEKRSIAAARNGGAHAARGEVVAFVDADMRIHPETFNAIDAALVTGRYVGGATGVRLERWSLGILVTWLLLVPWVVLLRMDTGVVFVRREDFKRVGGYDERRAFAEDVALLICLKRLGRSRGQTLARVTAAKALTSMRKFDRYGDWHYFSLFARLGFLMLRHPHASTDLVRRYWYEDER
jgi:glycosyltransferase involved in cell wall biosynthesis